MIPFRVSYWHIQPVWIFYLLAIATLTVLGLGIAIHVSVWRKGIKRQSVSFSLKDIFKVIKEGILGTRIFKGDVAAGTMHGLIIWGFLILFVGTLALSADYWMFPFLHGSFYLLYSFCLELAGLMLITGLIWALIRRYVQRVPRLERRFEDLLVPVWLLAVAISGYLAEGSRLGAQSPEWAGWSFVGYGLSHLWSGQKEAMSAYPWFWWLHALLSMGFIAYIPFSKLFHILAAPVSIYLENQPLQIIPVESREEEVFSYREAIFFDACTRCGRCVEVCPSAGAGEPFTPRDFIAWAKQGLLTDYHLLNSVDRFKNWMEQRGTENGQFDASKIWHCTTCRACLEVCPVYVATPDAIRSARSKVVEQGTEMPDLLARSLKNVYKYHNPWEATKKKRAKWASDLDIPNLTKEADGNRLCYFVGCTTSMELRAQALAQSFVKILNHAEVPFGTLGKKEPCCGDIARRAGEDGLFEMKMEDCSDLFQSCGIQDVVTSSPHCFHTFRNEYPPYMTLREPDEQVSFRVRHYTEVLAELLGKGSLKFENSLGLKVTYHDPCYLGRYNRIFDAPREVIRAIPGVKLLEMTHHRENSLCCGGGGDRMWQEEMDGDPKMSEIRMQEAAATGADVVITACPLCLIMLEDALKTSGLENKLRIMDLNELVAMALELK